MVCIYCGGDTKVTNSRPQRRHNQVWRRRQCLVCQSVFTTHEQIELESALSVSKNGRLEPFLPDLLQTELANCLRHRKDAYTAPKQLLGTIVRRLLALPQSPVFEPTDISEVSAGILKRFDRQAYLRYQADHPSLQ